MPDVGDERLPAWLEDPRDLADRLPPGEEPERVTLSRQNLKLGKAGLDVTLQDGHIIKSF